MLLGDGSVKLGNAAESEATLLRRGFEALLDRLADEENRPAARSGLNLGASSAVLSRWPVDNQTTMQEIRSHAQSQKARIRNVNFFARVLAERDKLRCQQGTLLEEVQHELPRLRLTHLIRLRLLQSDSHEFPDSLSKVHRFLEDTENLALQKFFARFCELPPPKAAVTEDLLRDYIRRLRGSAATAIKRALAKDVLITLGVAKTVKQPGWWRLAFPIELAKQQQQQQQQPDSLPPHQLPPHATALTSARVAPAAAGAAAEGSPDEGGSSSIRASTSARQTTTATPLSSAEVRERSSKRMQLARSRSVEAIRSQFQQSGTALVDLFVGLPDIVISTVRPASQDVYLAHNPDLSLRGQVLALEIWRVPPQTSLHRFFRPQDFNVAMRRELRNSIHARATSLSRMPPPQELAETSQGSPPTSQGSPTGPAAAAGGGGAPLSKGGQPPSLFLEPAAVLTRRLGAAAQPKSTPPEAFGQRPTDQHVTWKDSSTDCSAPPTQQPPPPPPTPQQQQQQPTKLPYAQVPPGGAPRTRTGNLLSEAENGPGLMSYFFPSFFGRKSPTSAGKDGHLVDRPSAWPSLSMMPVSTGCPARTVTYVVAAAAAGGGTTSGEFDRTRPTSGVRVARRSTAGGVPRRMESPSNPPVRAPRKLSTQVLPEIYSQRLELAASGRLSLPMSLRWDIPADSRIPRPVSGGTRRPNRTTIAGAAPSLLSHRAGHVQ